jgi:HAD superfamily hydrolase (TIGR01509 family)
MDVHSQRNWIFDMDGTLTKPMHDFGFIKKKLNIDERSPVLESIEAMDANARMEAHSILEAWEEELAYNAVASDDAVVLLQTLLAENANLGVLTRNKRRLAIITLNASGLSKYFNERDILGRDCAAPKPSPAGVLKLTAGWDSSPMNTVMVGDYVHDIDAGNAAGCTTVLVRRGSPVKSSSIQATYVVDDLRELLSLRGSWT